ncbi:hypothetical protein [Desulfoluna sp.]|uniref:hypothetical protein n=1 Tax=Desulfoluna sp. TaxID=2045199 RepID=UPI002611C93E|nr:hypothetical protein [Desulfoluna sp.]
MNQVFTEMFKGFDSWKSWDMSKNLEMFNSPDAARMGVRFIDFQKSAFNTTFDTMLKMQEQSQKMTTALMSGNKSMPDSGQKLMDDWQTQLTTNQNEFRKYITDHYDQLIGMLNPKDKK